jgi:hypothetical protein
MSVGEMALAKQQRQAMKKVGAKKKVKKYTGEPVWRILNISKYSSKV